MTADLGQLEDALNQKVLSGDISGYMYIPENIIEGGTVEFAAENVSDFEKISSINKVLNAVIGSTVNRAFIDPVLLSYSHASPCLCSASSFHRDFELHCAAHHDSCRNDLDYRKDIPGRASYVWKAPQLT